MTSGAVLKAYETSVISPTWRAAATVGEEDEEEQEEEWREEEREDEEEEEISVCGAKSTVERWASGGGEQQIHSS